MKHSQCPDGSTVLGHQLAAGVAAGPPSPAPVTSEAIVAGVLGVIDAQLATSERPRLLELIGALMSFIVLPYEGPEAAHGELERAPAHLPRRTRSANRNAPARQPIRITYRTMRVLRAVGEQHALSNAEVAQRAGITDPGQVSKLLKRLVCLGLIENTGGGVTRGQSNAWWLTDDGKAIERALGVKQHGR
jgi:DNA-binding MarR family transcriptional regulator